MDGTPTNPLKKADDHGSQGGTLYDDLVLKLLKILEKNRSELSLEHLDAGEILELAGKLAEVLYSFEKEKDRSDGNTVLPGSTQELNKESQFNILRKIIGRYRRIEKYSELKKLLGMLEKKGFFDLDVKYDKQRYTPTGTMESDRYVTYLMHKLDTLCNAALDKQRYQLSPEKARIFAEMGSNTRLDLDN